MNTIIIYSTIGAVFGSLHSIKRKRYKDNGNVFFYIIDLVLGVLVAISLNCTYLPKELEIMALVSSIIIGDFIDYGLNILGEKMPDIIVKFVDKVTDIFLR